MCDARVKILCISLLSQNLDERVRSFNSITPELMDEFGAEFDEIFSDQAVLANAANTTDNITKKGVDARLEAHGKMTNTFNNRMEDLRNKLFLC
jgi:hypothetical protein